jgi:hypothetical protein
MAILNEKRHWEQNDRNLNKFYHILTFFLFAAALPLAAQQTGVLYGTVLDQERVPVPNANITVKDQPGGTTADKQGKFDIRVPAGKKLTVTFSCIGFETESHDVQVKPDERKEFNTVLSKSTTELKSIEIKDQQLRTNTFNRLDPKAVTVIPTMNASVEDLIKTMPGVSSRNELSSQYSVRGGNFDENLVFVNDIEIYRPFLVRAGQQEGLSFLNPDLVSSISFSAGGFDAKFGDKMSSVLDIKYKRPTTFAGSFDVSLLGANGHIEGSIAKKLTYLMGVRYKSNSYFLKGLDTKGSYKPRYFDFQGVLGYDISSKWDLSILGMYSNNSFKLVPQTQETSFGTRDQAYKIKIFFDGQEVDQYQNWIGAATLTFKPNNALRLKLISSFYQTKESETYDISAEYWLGTLESFQGNSNSGLPTDVLGVGAFLDHARNYLDGTVFNVEHRGTWETAVSNMQWGLRYQHDFFRNVMNEWELKDSAGYSLPHPVDSLGNPNPAHDPMTLNNILRSNNTLDENRISCFLQNTWTIKNTSNDISLTAGVRGIYQDFSGQFLVNPRVNVSFKPHWKNETVFRVSGGYYSQPPTFRELTDLNGNIVKNLKAQNSLQAVLGSDYYFSAWERPFKFVTEIYYKYLTDVIPYEIDNLKIRYYGNNDAFGYAAGIDFRINGEFVKGAESWASLSIMQTQENINGDWIPRPTDQRVNLSIFFQDYIPKYPSWKVNLTLCYGTGLPFGPPGSPRNEQTLRIPAYKRVDIGLSKQLIGDKTSFTHSNPFRVFKSMWISLEVFNLLQISNVASYIWITGVDNRQYAVPNYLTPRQINLKLIASF